MGENNCLRGTRCSSTYGYTSFIVCVNKEILRKPMTIIICNLSIRPKPKADQIGCKRGCDDTSFVVGDGDGDGDGSIYR
jgi:hypothetical protein